MSGSSNARRTALFVASLSIVAILLVALGGVFAGLAQALLLMVGGAVFGTILAGLTQEVVRHTPLSSRAATALVPLALFLLVVLAFFGMGARISGQIDGLIDSLEEAFAQLETRYENAAWLEPVRSMRFDGESASLGTWLGRAVGGASWMFGALADVFILAVLALFFAIEPELYGEKASLLVRERHRETVEELQRDLAHALRIWFVGRALSAALVGVLTWIALAILGIRLAGVLAALAAILSFIPNFGPLLSVLPAALVGWTRGSATLLWVLGIYFVIQLVESNALTPLIQKKAVSLPPALLLSGQLLFGALFGILGLFLATPLLVIGIVLVQRLYLIETLGEDVRVLGRSET